MSFQETIVNQSRKRTTGFWQGLDGVVALVPRHAKMSKKSLVQAPASLGTSHPTSVELTFPQALLPVVLAMCVQLCLTTPVLLQNRSDVVDAV